MKFQASPSVIRNTFGGRLPGLAAPQQQERSSAPLAGLFVSLGIVNHRQEPDWYFTERLRSVGNIAEECYGISWTEQIGMFANPILQFSLQHVNELGALVLKTRKDFTFVIEGN